MICRHLYYTLSSLYITFSKQNIGYFKRPIVFCFCFFLFFVFCFFFFHFYRICGRLQVFNTDVFFCCAAHQGHCVCPFYYAVRLDTTAHDIVSIPRLYSFSVCVCVSVQLLQTHTHTQLSLALSLNMVSLVSTWKCSPCMRRGLCLSEFVITP